MIQRKLFRAAKLVPPQVQQLRQLRSNCAAQILGGISIATDGSTILDQTATVKNDPPHPIAPSTLRTQSQRKFPSASYILHSLFIGVQKHGKEPSIRFAVQHYTEAANGSDVKLQSCSADIYITLKYSTRTHHANIFL